MASRALSTKAQNGLMGHRVCELDGACEDARSWISSAVRPLAVWHGDQKSRNLSPHRCK